MNSTQKKDMYDLEPSEFYLSQNYPNPFSDSTAIKYCIAYKTKVRLEVFNPEGKMIKVLVDEEKEVGTYEVEFDATDCQSGEDKNLIQSIFTYQLQAKDFLSMKKMIGLNQLPEYFSFSYFYRFKNTKLQILWQILLVYLIKCYGRQLIKKSLLPFQNRRCSL